MSSELNIEQVDVDGDIRETAHEATEALDSGDTRARLPEEGRPRRRRRDGRRRAARRPHPRRRDGRAGKGRPPAKFGKGDIGILNYALTLEYLEAAFYNEATANEQESFLKGAAGAAFLKRTTADENAHVAFLKKALGSKAVAAPKVDFGGTTSERGESFIETASRWRTPASTPTAARRSTSAARPTSRRRSRSGRSRPVTPRSPACSLKADPGEHLARTAPSTRPPPRPKSSRQSKQPASSSSAPRGRRSRLASTGSADSALNHELEDTMPNIGPMEISDRPDHRPRRLRAETPAGARASRSAKGSASSKARSAATTTRPRRGPPAIEPPPVVVTPAPAPKTAGRHHTSSTPEERRCAA